MDPVEVVISDRTYYITPLRPFQQLEYFFDLQKELLPAFGDVLSLKSAPEGEEAEGTDKAMAAAIRELSTRLSGQQIAFWTDRLLTKDTISVEMDQGMTKLDKATREQCFENFTDILELLYHVVMINFKDPIQGFLTRFGLTSALSKAVNKIKQ